MKKILLSAALAIASLAASAQDLHISSLNGTDVSKYDGRTMNVKSTRNIFNGWNTIALPFDVTTDQLSEIFGNDFKLEKLSGVTGNDNGLTLIFADVKEEGIKANVPYILHYTGDKKYVKINVEGVTVKEGTNDLSFMAPNGITVDMCAAKVKTEVGGNYGILAADNAEAKFVSVEHTNSVFYATRCFIKLSNGTSTPLFIQHVGAGAPTSIEAIENALAGNEAVDVFNEAGQKVGKMKKGDFSKLSKGIYIIKGMKVAK